MNLLFSHWLNWITIGRRTKTNKINSYKKDWSIFLFIFSIPKKDNNNIATKQLTK